MWWPYKHTLNRIINGQERQMEELEKLKQAVSAFIGDLKEKVAALKAKVDELTTHPVVENHPDLAGLIAEINAAKAELDGAAAAPVTTPGDTPPTTGTTEPATT